MAHDVFISYSSKDLSAGEAVCETLERRGLRCWIAPRHIAPGVGWAKSIVRAIGQSGAMVLVLSENANNSPQIEREVERAVNKGVPIIPVRIENVPLSEALEYFLSSPHWLDAFKPPLGPHLDRLADAVHVLLGLPAAQPESRRIEPAPAKPAALSQPPAATTASQTIFAGVEGTERNLAVVAALSAAATVVVLLSAGALTAAAMF